MVANKLSPVASLPVLVHLQGLTSSPHNWLDDKFGTKKTYWCGERLYSLISNLWSTSVNDWGVPVVTDEGSPLGKQRELRVWSMVPISSIGCNHACCLISPLTPATESIHRDMRHLSDIQYLLYSPTAISLPSHPRHRHPQLLS
ncbi:hypothetical protein BDN67DRAFT_568785 [Paxillus ammoniavirescens]|nr:hypothetical protein BDN67DRAFT_568785 [Paxillus ammoniavirescens]